MQATLNVYTTVTRADGHTIKVHLDQGEGQNYRTSPGNLLSNVEKVRIDPKAGGVVKIALATEEPAHRAARRTRSTSSTSGSRATSSASGGAPTSTSAPSSCCPKDGPNTRTRATRSSTTRATSRARSAASARRLRTRQRHRPQQHQQDGAYRFYQDWVSGKMGRVIIVLIQHPTPFYDDSYAVNSANNGPYGDALWQEFVPRVEKEFRGISASRGRA